MTHSNDDWGPTTQWTRIRLEPRAGQTWQFLMKRYRGPVLSWVRRRLSRHPEAEDIALDFFSYLYEHGLVEQADRDRGKFRAYLQGILRNFLLRELRNTSKLNAGQVEELEMAAEVTPDIEAREEADWARRSLHNACKQLIEQSPRNGAMLMESYGLKPYKKCETDELAERYELKPNAVYKALFDARAKLAKLLEDEVRNTTSDDDSFESEWEVVQARLREVQGRLMGDLETATTA